MSTNKTPTSVTALADQLVSLEKQNEMLKQKNRQLNQKLEQMKNIAVNLLTRSNRQNSFTNYQVRDWGNQILSVLNANKRPSDFTPKR